MDGNLYSWGSAENGKLGHPPYKGDYHYIEHYPKKVKFIIFLDSSFELSQSYSGIVRIKSWMCS
jgi:hypothetical protein